MAAHVLRLRLALFLGAFRGDPGTVARRIFGLVVLVVAVIGASAGLLTLGRSSQDGLLFTTVVGGSVVTLGFLVAPLLLALDDPLDPRRFALLGVPPLRVSLITAGAGMLSVPALAVGVVATAAAVAWSRQGVPWPIGALSVVLVVLTCGLFARVGMGLRALLLRHRGVPRLAGLFVVLLLALLVAVAVFSISHDWHHRMTPATIDALRIVAVTPIGAAWGLPGSVAVGGSLAGPLVVADAAVAVLAVVWIGLGQVLLATPERRIRVRERAGLGWFGALPSTPAGAIAARSILYWTSDRRYLVNLVVVPIAAAITALPLLVAGVPLGVAVVVPVPIAALLFGWLPHDDLAYDSTAVWMHIAGGVRGLADRIGRLVPILLIAVPVLAIAIPVTIAVGGRWPLLPALVGVCASLFLCGLGLSSIDSVAAPYAVTRPGDSPFQQPQRTGSAGAFGQAAVLLGSLVLTVPAFWYGWLAVTGTPGAATTALWVGLGSGVVVLVVGVGIGAAVFGRSGGRLMEFAEAT